MFIHKGDGCHLSAFLVIVPFPRYHRVLDFKLCVNFFHTSNKISKRKELRSLVAYCNYSSIQKNFINYFNLLAKIRTAKFNHEILKIVFKRKSHFCSLLTLF